MEKGLTGLCFYNLPGQPSYLLAKPGRFLLFVSIGTEFTIMLTNFFIGLDSWKKAMALIARHGLWGYVLLPGVISLLLAALLLMLGWSMAGDIGGWMQGIYPENWWGRGIVDNAAGVLAFLLTALLLIFTYKYLVMIVVAPFLGPLSEKVESVLTGKPAPPFSLKHMVRDTMRALRITFRNIIREVIYTLFLLFLQLIPLVGTVVSTVMIFLVQAYYAGFGNMDPTLERRAMKVRERVAFVGENRWLAIGNGSLFVLLMFVPLVGWFLAPAIGTVGATALAIEKLE